MARTARAIQKVTQLVDRSIPTMAAIPTTTHIRIGSVVLLLLIIYLYDHSVVHPTGTRWVNIAYFLHSVPPRPMSYDPAKESHRPPHPPCSTDQPPHSVVFCAVRLVRLVRWRAATFLFDRCFVLCDTRILFCLTRINNFNIWLVVASEAGLRPVCTYRF